MKKLFFFMLIGIFTLSIGSKTYAQLSNGSYAKNFIMTDIDGNVQNLYSYLDAGKPVVVDISAVWCGPCYSYHLSGKLETLYNTYGPPGTNELQVLWIEGDQGTLAQLNGGSGSQGDWTDGTTFPMILTIAPNNTQVCIDYEIGYFPTVYMICPDRKVKEVGTGPTAAQLYTAAMACPDTTTAINDASAFNLLAPKWSYCASQVTPKFTIQNYGNSILTSASIISKIDGVVKATTPWTGSLGRYEVEEVTLPVITGIADGTHTYTVQVTSPNGQPDPTVIDDSLKSSFTVISNGVTVQVKTITDDYPGETSWVLKDGTTTIAQSDKFKTPNHTYTNNVCILPEHCYTFILNDSYGDAGAVAQVISGGVTLVNITATSYTYTKSVDFCNYASVNENNESLSLSVFPNPITDVANIQFNLTENQNVSVKIHNIVGEVVYNSDLGMQAAGTQNITVNTSNLSAGIYLLDLIIGNTSISKKLSIVK
jgi:thiol-disulfide isomerase/thioredoxin